MTLLVIKPTFACNFNCPTCQERRTLYRQLQKDKQLSIDDWLLCFDYAIPYFDKLTISGAEPLLYKDLYYMLHYSKFKNISLNTNALLLDQNTTHDLVESNLSEICISLTSLDSTTFMKLRNTTNVYAKDKIIKNIQYFNTYKKNILSVGMTFLTKYNLFELPKMILSFKYLGFNCIVIDLLEGNFNSDEYRITEEQVIEFEKSMLFKIPYMYREELKQLLYKAITKEYRTYEQCNVPGNFCIILANGDVHPCNIHEYSHEPIIGNLFNYDMDIMKIMNNESSKHFQKDRSKYCSRCPIKINMCIRYE